MSSPMPRLVLALEASSARCSVVLWAEESGSPDTTAAGHVVARHEGEGQTGDAARLPGIVAALLAARALAPADLAMVAVSVGPGSFTGLRASLSFAAGLAAGAGIPVIGVSVAEAMAVAARAEAGVAALPLWCALDSRAGRLFLHRGGAPEAWEIAFLTDPPMPPGPLALTGDAAEALGLALRDRAAGAAIVTPARFSHAREIAIAGLRRMRGLLPPLPAAPLYVDPPRALLPKAGLRPPPFEASCGIWGPAPP